MRLSWRCARWMWAVGDEVITQPNSFIATAEAISATGATPIFADVDERTATIDPEQSRPQDLAAHEGDHSGASLWATGAHAASRARWRARFLLIEDACQAHGARLHGERAGAMGTLACLSFDLSKHLGAYGEGGAVTTNDPELADRVRIIRDHGSKVRYEHDVIGRNARMDELQAAILDFKLRYLDEWNERRRANAAPLSAALEGTSLIFLPEPGGAGVYEVFHLYVVRHPERDQK